MENLTDKQDNTVNGASCNASVSTPFFFFLGLAAIVAVVLYLVL